MDVSDRRPSACYVTLYLKQLPGACNQRPGFDNDYASTGVPYLAEQDGQGVCRDGFLCVCFRSRLCICCSQALVTELWQRCNLISNGPQRCIAFPITLRRRDISCASTEILLCWRHSGGPHSRIDAVFLSAVLAKGCPWFCRCCHRSQTRRMPSIVGTKHDDL